MTPPISTTPSSPTATHNPGLIVIHGDVQHQVDPRWLAGRLESAIASTGAERGWSHDHSIRQSALGLLHDDPADADSRVTGIELADGSAIMAGEVVVANGLAASQLSGLPAWLKLPLRPVYGDILRLRIPAHLRPLLTATILGFGGAYVFVKQPVDGRLGRGCRRGAWRRGRRSAGGRAR
jgi:glycine oxidase